MGLNEGPESFEKECGLGVACGAVGQCANPGFELQKIKRGGIGEGSNGGGTR
jgi:hypothetical protein